LNGVEVDGGHQHRKPARTRQATQGAVH
jgi:hypothetical protein